MIDSYNKSLIWKDKEGFIDYHWFSGTSTEHMHTDYYELFFTVDENISHKYLGETTTLLPNTIILVLPNHPHLINAPTKSRHFNISFTDELLQNICSTLHPDFYSFLVNGQIDFKTILSTKNASIVLSRINNLLNTFYADERQQKIYECYVVSILHSLLTHIYADIFLGRKRAQEIYPDWFQQYLHQLHKPEIFVLPLSDIYKLSGYSPSVIINYFTHFTGQKMIDYINTIKIEYAQVMLRKTNYDVSKISSSCGFNSLSYFVKLFKKHTGMTPTQYRSKASRNIY